MSLSSFFGRCRVALFKFSYCFKFHVIIMTSCEVMKILIDKGLTRNPKIKNTLVCVSPNIWGLGQVRDTKFDTNVSNKVT